MDTEIKIEDEMPFKCIVIKDFSDNYIRYDMFNTNLAGEIEEFLKTFPLTCYFNSYHLEIEKSGKRLKHDDNLFAMDLVDFDVIKMVPNYYNSVSAKVHFDVVKYVLEIHPYILTEDMDIKEIVSKDYNKLVENSNKNFENNRGKVKFPYFGYLFENQQADNDDENEESKLNAGKEEIQEESKKSETKKKHSPKDLETKQKNYEEKFFNQFEELKQILQDVDYRRTSVNSLPLSAVFESKSRINKFKCFNSMTLSSFNNKIENKESPIADLLYIDVVTLENNSYYITCSDKGFFLNKSKVSVYDPNPLNNLVSYTLPGLLSLISPGFKDNFGKTLLQFKTDDSLNYLASNNDNYEWLVEVENPFAYNYRYKQFKPSLYDYNSLNKEWNEEYQAIIDIKGMESNNMDAKEKILIPFYKYFKDVAIKGVQLIVEKRLKPFSMTDTNNGTNDGYFIYGNIFITVLEPSLDFMVRFIY